MDDAHDAEPEHSPYLRLPWPLVAGGLVAVLVLALAAGLFANRYLRPQVTVVPTPNSPAAAPPPAMTSAPAPMGVPTPTITSAPTPVVQTTILAPTATASRMNVMPTSTSAATPTSAPIATLTASALPTVDPLLSGEVGRSYEWFWRVRSQALLELDTTHLAEVMDADYLRQFESNLRDLRAQGRAIKTEVALNYVVADVTSDAAMVIDHVEDDSFYVTPGTLQPLTDPANDVLHIEFKLRKTDGVWKVVDSVSAD